MYVLCAPDSFKGTLSANEVAAAFAEGVRQAGAQHVELPLADGGEGTAAVIATALGARAVTADVHDPLGRPVSAEWFDGGAIGIVEMARASGLPLVAEHDRDAIRASTYGTGELIAAAIATGCTTIYVTVGGSATTDGGAGAIEAIEADGGMPNHVELRILTDVTTSFNDAARIFAPQKGADADAVVALTHRLDAYAQTLPRDPRGVPRTGAGGGISGGLWAQYGAHLESGIDTVLDLVGFDRILSGEGDSGEGDSGEGDSGEAGRGVRTGESRTAPKLVLTGEGRFDGQTPYGKVVAGVAHRAHDVPVVVIAGSIGDGSDDAVKQLQLHDLVVASTREQIVEAARAVTATVLGADD